MYAALLSCAMVAVDAYRDHESHIDTPKRFVPSNADVYPSSGVDPLRVELDRGDLQRVGRPGGFDALYDARYLSSDPHIRDLEVLVLDEICTRSQSIKGDPFNIFGDDSDAEIDESDEEASASFLDLSSIPLDNYHVLAERPVEKIEEPKPVFQLPSIVVKPVAKQEPQEKPQERKPPRKPAMSFAEKPKQESEELPAEVGTGIRAQLMKEIRSTGDKPRVSFVRQHNSADETDDSDDSFFSNTSEPLSLRRKKVSMNAPKQKKNSLHAYINKPKPTSIMHSDSFREAFSFAMQHRRSKLREDSKSSDVSNEASGDSFDFM